MELIKISNDGDKKTVNARDLHTYLKSKQEFSTWIKKRVKDYDFIDGQDFVTNDKKNNRQILKEYHISLDMAKELSMVERNDKGKKARKYFIECEKQSQTMQPRRLPGNYKEALLALVDAEEEKEKLIEQAEFLEHRLDDAKGEIKTLEPMAEYGHNIYTSVNLYTVTNIGQQIGLSAGALNKHLKRLNIIRKGTGRYTDYELCMRYSKLGLIKYDERPGQNSKQEKVTFRNLRWTRKGYDWMILNEELIKDNNRKSLPLPKESIVKI